MLALPWHCWQPALEKKLQNLPVPARNTIAIFILLVIDTVLISLTAVAERCFECCMALVNFLSLLSIYLICDPRVFEVHVTGARKEAHQVNPDTMETNGSIFFHFH